MRISRNDVEFTPLASSTVGGQAANKNATGVRAIHVPTGISVTVRTRSLERSKKKALKELDRKVVAEGDREAKEASKQRRLAAIKNTRRVRTYDESRGVVTDHITGKVASVKDVLGKGRLDRLK